MPENGIDNFSRVWWDFCFANPDIVTPTDTALYFFCIEHCARLGWKRKFGLPKQMAMDAIGVRNWRTFSQSFNNLVDWGFVRVVEKSKNQYSANIIAVVKNAKAPTKARTQALLQHAEKHDVTEVEKNKNENSRFASYQDVIDMYHRICVSMPKVVKVTEKRKRQIVARTREIEKAGRTWEEVFTMAEASDFLSGRKTSYRANIDFMLCNTDHWTKIIEGAYANNKTGATHNFKNVEHEEF